jgi:hypothetical protein
MVLDVINGSLVFPDDCPDDCRFCDDMMLLAVISGNLENRGLQTSLDTCDTETPKGHYDSVLVTNPKEPERGAFHLDADGTAAWHWTAADLRHPALLDEISHVLRVNGLPRRVRRS